MSERALEVVRAGLAGRPAWLVGGAVRDLALGRPVGDLDVVLDGDPEQAARAVAAAARGIGAGAAACFALSERFGAWRVVARDGSWQVDVEPLRGESLRHDLALRDFTVNAIAEPLGGGAPLDPLGGLEDLRAGRLRLAGPGAFEDDPLRVLRLVRVAVELELTPDTDVLLAARAQAGRLLEISPERVFVELRRIVASDRALRGIEMLREVHAAAVVLPELEAMRGVGQSRYHHRDVYGHTLEVLERAIELTAGSAPLDGSPARERAGDFERGAVELLGEHRVQVHELLAEPLADEMTRGEALRWGALLHDAAKPATRAVRPWDRRVTFVGHDVLGADLARDVLGRLRASVRLREHVAALVRHHLALGFLVHEPQPLARTTVFDYLHRCGPVGADVTLLSMCDRLATRGAKATEAIEAHVALARAMLADALRWRAEGPPAPLLRGDELAAEIGIALGPRVGELLAELARAQYAGEVATREQALAFARRRESRARAG